MNPPPTSSRSTTPQNSLICTETNAEQDADLTSLRLSSPRHRTVAIMCSMLTALNHSRYPRAQAEFAFASEVQRGRHQR